MTSEPMVKHTAQGLWADGFPLGKPGLSQSCSQPRDAGRLSRVMQVEAQSRGALSCALHGHGKLCP